MPDRTSSPSSENASQEEDGHRENKASWETDGFREERRQGPRAGQSDELAPLPFSSEGSRVGNDRADPEDGRMTNLRVLPAPVKPRPSKAPSACASSRKASVGWRRLPPRARRRTRPEPTLRTWRTFATGASGWIGTGSRPPPKHRPLPWGPRRRPQPRDPGATAGRHRLSPQGGRLRVARVGGRRPAPEDLEGHRQREDPPAGWDASAYGPRPEVYY